MSVKRHTCVWLECDGATCPESTQGGWADGAPHFDSEADALKYAIGDEDGWGWTQRPDGRLLCGACSKRTDCEATGHQWSEWRPTPVNDGIDWRYCQHCDVEDEQRIAGTDVIL